MKIVFFDGYCSLCNSLVNWLIQIDKTSELKFASLQGETAAQQLGRNIAPLDINTVIYLRYNQKYERSSAILRVLSDIGGFWSLARIFLLVPKFIRDGVYRLVARNRYQMFGKRDTCRIPKPEELNRLLP